MQTIDVKISGQATYMIEGFKDFPYEKFMEWWLENKCIVGGGHVLEYIEKFLIKKGDKK